MTAKILFSAQDGSDGTELWSTDGTTATLVDNIYPGSGGSYPLYITPLAGTGLAVFAAADSTNGKELWVTDGTATGTKLIKNINPSGSSYPGGYGHWGIVSFGNKALFSADNGTTVGLWSTNGTTSGTLQINLTDGSDTAYNPNNIIVLGNKALFSATDSTHGNELWITDGTSAGTHRITDLYASFASSYPSHITLLGNGKAVFQASDGTNSINGSTPHGNELWVTDGTTTTLVKDINPGRYSSTPGGIAVTGGIVALGGGSSKAVFQADDGTHGIELWVTDGTKAGTTLVKDIYSGSASGVPYELTALGNGKAVFQAGDATHSTELWVTNGTSAGTMLVKDIDSGLGSSDPQDLTALGNGKALFRAFDGSTSQLWITDGTAAGTKEIIINQSGSSSPNYITAIGNGQAVFQAEDGTHGTELWITNGTAAGTKLVSNIYPGVDSSNPKGFAVIQFAPIPPPTVIGLGVASDLGSQGDTMTVTGTGATGEIVTLSDGTTSVGTATVIGGTWSITTAHLASGGHSLTARQKDTLGDASSSSAARQLTITLGTPNAVTFFGGAGADHFTGGAGNDVFKFAVANLANTDTVIGGGGSDTLTMTTAGTVNAAGVSGVETFQLASVAANSLTLANANFAGTAGSTITVLGGAAGNTVNGSALTGSNKLVFTGGAGADHFSGGAGNDVFKFAVANLANTDTLIGSGGSDTLMMTTAGTINAAGVSGVETVQLASGAANSLTLANANFTGTVGSTVTVQGGATGNTVSGSALTGSNKLVVTGGAGADHFTGGAGNDVFKFAVANLANTDTVIGGGGSDTLTMTTAGTVNAAGVSGVETVQLASGAANSLTLANANFTGTVGSTVTVQGGATGNTVSGSALTGSNKLVVTGGAGADHFTGGAGNDKLDGGAGNDSMTGGGGSDSFVFDATLGASNVDTIFDFTHLTDKVLLSHSVFTAAGPVGALAATAFVDVHTTAETASSRIVYDSSSGALSYDAGGAGGSTPIKFATLSTHPVLTNADFTIV